jgi:LacI family transcriptional regulator
MHWRITQKEIAGKLGVSQALVSRALSGTSERISASPATARRIRAAAAKWGYRPSAAALTLKGASARTLGVLIKDFDDPFFGHMVGELQRLARAQGYSLLLIGWVDDKSDADVASLRKYQLDGLILCGSDIRPRAVEGFLAEGRPVAQIGVGRTMPGVRQVSFDEAQGLAQIVEFLRGLGHTEIAYVGDDSASHLRRARHLRAILRVRSDWLVGIPRQASDGGRAAVKKWLCQSALGTRVTAIIAGDDVMAQTVRRALHECGRRVPEDVSLTGMDDIPAARMMIPALTTVRQPVQAMVRSAFRLATEPQLGKQARRAILIAPELVTRESCAAPAGGSKRGRAER